MIEKEIDFEKRFRDASDAIIQIASNMTIKKSWKIESFDSIIKICEAQLNNHELKNDQDKRLSR